MIIMAQKLLAIIQILDNNSRYYIWACGDIILDE